MQVTCDQCQSKFKIPDEKVPGNKALSLRCPKCKGTITIGGSVGGGADLSDDYDAEDRPFDFIEEEGKTALVCEHDTVIREQVVGVLEMLEYHITVCDGARDALKKMRYHLYDLIVVNEMFDTADPNANGLLIFLERQNMAVRRGIFLLLISSRFRTMDNMAALHRSVNLIINPENIADFERILKRGLTDQALTYRVFRETLKRLGRM